MTNTAPDSTVPRIGADTTVYRAVPPQVILVPAEPRGMSTASFVLAMVSVAFGMLFFLPLASFILGIVALKKEPAGRGLAIAGIVISGLILLVWAAIAGFFLLLAGGAAMSGAASSVS